MAPITLADPSSELVAAAGGASAQGDYRENNEDYLLIEPDPPACLVLDGMGGHAAGELASRTAGDSILASLRRGAQTTAEPREWIGRAVRSGHDHVRELGRQDTRARNCGTTVVLALLRGGRLFVTWVGDSLAYRVSNGKAERLTRPHDMRQALIDAGVLSEAEARGASIGGRLVQYLGSDEPPRPAEVLSFEPRPGDRFVLATDGVTGTLEESDLLDVCRGYADPQACAEHLVRLAMEHGSRDNCTCAVITFPGGEAAPAPPPRKWWHFWR